MKKYYLILALLLASTTLSQAKLTLNHTISDGMVLQQQTQARIWGRAEAGETVKISTSWNGKDYSVYAAVDGKWEARVITPAASYKAYKIIVSCKGEKIVVNDVLIGEVWMASGQSNMEMPIRGFFNCPVEGSQQVMTAPPMPDKIRMLTVNIFQSLEPQEDIHQTRGWEKAGPETVSEMSATAYFFARQLNESMDVPVGIIAFARGGSRVEGWVPKETAQKWGEDVSEEGLKKYDPYHEPSTMYYGMEQPVKGYTSKGFIWYQGCSNVGSHNLFVERMSFLVKNFRSDWGDDKCEMPFYMVEIAPYDYNPGQEEVGQLLRKAQHDAAKTIPNSGIVVTNDLVYSYERNNIHPCRKQEVGRRLAYMALHRNYGYSRLVCDSPEALEAYMSKNGDGKIHIKMSNCPNGLNRSLEIEGLEICGSDNIWKPVRTVSFSYEHHELTINCDGVPSPCAVRYGWGDFKPGNLANAEGFGAVPFCLSIK